MKDFRGSLLIYLLAFIFAGITPFVLLPILTRQLSPLQFGEAAAFLNFVAILASAVGLSSNSFVAVRYFKTPGVQFKLLVTSVLVAVYVLHATILLIFSPFYHHLILLLKLPIDYIVIAIGASSVLCTNFIFLSIFQSSNQPLRYLLLRFIQSFAEISLCVGAASILAPNSGIRVYTYIIAIAASTFMGWYCCYRDNKIGMRIDPSSIKGLVAYGIPALPHTVAGIGLMYSDRLMVSSLLGAESLGIFTVALQLGMAMSLINEPLNKALAPWLFEKLSKSDAGLNREIVKSTYVLFVLLVLVGILFAALLPIIFDQIVGPGYSKARVLLPWFILGFVFQGMYYTVTNYLFYAEKTGRLSIASGLAAIIGCAVSFGLTSTNGLEGAAISFAIGNALLFIFVWLAAASAVPMPWLLRKHG